MNAPPVFFTPPDFKMNVKSKRIKDFNISGTIADDAFIVGHRERMEKLLDIQMRDFGYVPHLDLDTQYFISYNEDRGTYDFECISFGVYVGKKRSWEIVGLSGTQYVYKGQ